MNEKVKLFRPLNVYVPQHFSKQFMLTRRRRNEFEIEILFLLFPLLCGDVTIANPYNCPRS